MSSDGQSPPARREQRLRTDVVIVFAAIMMIILGLLDALWGLAAIFNEGIISEDGHGVLIGNIATWGWVSLLGGSLVAITGFGLGLGIVAARWAAVVLVAVNAVMNIVWFPAAPVWSFMVIFVDVTIIYVLILGWDEWTEGSD